jgi:hypothetical protein
MVWMNKDLVDKKKESNSPVWCSDCIQKAGHDPDTHLAPVNWKQFCDIKDKARKVGPDEWDVPGITPPDLEGAIMEHAARIGEDMLQHLEQVIPALCVAYMSKLKVYDNPMDLGIACSVAAFIERSLLDRKERTGDGFEGFSDDQKMRVFLFLYGLRDAVEAFAEKHGKDELAMEDALSMEEFGEGMEYWLKNMRERHERRQ